MRERVRGVLITPAGRLLLVKRIRLGAAPYWVLPGGGVEAGDSSLEAALHREVHEELAGAATISSLLHVIEGDDRQYVFLARAHSWDPARRSGPEFADPARGDYVVEEVPLTAAGLAGITLVPASVACLLADHADRLFELPDLRSVRPPA
ncbi:NUDIX domain-containing protein [Streptosporangium sandarakinum]|uniref:NUDIX domain-containing protein n=1 Tax=Streptosporangium sandarakinum TaxID=1260955 RepID=UPI0036C17B8D